MPSSHAALSISVAPAPSSTGAMRAALAPSTTATASHDAAAPEPARTARAEDHADDGAARMLGRTRCGHVNRSGAFAEASRRCAGERRLHLGHQGERDLLRSLGTEVETHRRMHAAQHGIGDGRTRLGELREHALGPALRPEHTDVLYTCLEKRSQALLVAVVVVRHDDGERPRVP